MSDLYEGVKTIIDRDAKTNTVSATVRSISDGTVSVAIGASKILTNIPCPVGFTAEKGDVITLNRNPRTAKWQLSGPSSGFAPPRAWNTLQSAALSFGVGSLPASGGTLVIETLLKQETGALVNAGMTFNDDNDTANAYVVYLGGSSIGNSFGTSASLAHASAAAATADQFAYARITIPAWNVPGYRKSFHVISGGITSAYVSNGYWISPDPIESIQILQFTGSVNFIGGCMWRLTSF